MAIFRGGKRVGPFDIRLGLSRGREYDKKVWTIYLNIIFSKYILFIYIYKVI